jgi:hypothetical protein
VREQDGREGSGETPTKSYWGGGDRHLLAPKAPYKSAQGKNREAVRRPG